ncbi:hypothetical protein [Streptomyces achromogenes]|uniref:hypothetical protein n=1 Tax=Streptomyces achromogenes TaxID=67255 RepID=UPI00367E6171
MTTHPPIDPELAPVLAVVQQHVSPTITPGDIGALRANPAFAVLDEELTRDGTVELREFSARGPQAPPRSPCSSSGPPGWRPRRPSSTTCTAAA